MTESVESFTCSICFIEQLPQRDFIKMPCCYIEGSSTQYCKSCIEIIAQTGFDGRIGKCPTCSTSYKIENGVVVQSLMTEGICSMCRQMKGIVDKDRRFCDACLLGCNYSFKYECDRCHLIQTIPHPMWRYQETPNTFGTATWACHRRCSDYTHWKIVAEDISNIPHQLCPESWGLREEWLKAVRNQRLQTLNDNGREANSICIIG